jgi:hypothetical protein
MDRFSFYRTHIIIALNGIHKNVWFKEQVPQWLSDVQYDMQLFGGTGGAKVIKNMQTGDKILQLLLVNIDTFSTPKKWEAVIEWHKGLHFFVKKDIKIE